MNLSMEVSRENQRFPGRKREFRVKFRGKQGEGNLSDEVSMENSRGNSMEEFRGRGNLGVKSNLSGDKILLHQFILIRVTTVT